MNIKKTCYCFLIIFFISSCGVIRIEKRGYIFEYSNHELLQEGVTTADRVIKMMGSPTLVIDSDDDQSWIYYSEEERNFLFFRPAIRSRNILAIKFDPSKTIKELKRYELADGDKKSKFVSDYTKVDNHKTGLFKSFFSNVGQVKAQ